MSEQTVNVLVTGANSGLGLGICLRLIDDFLSKNQSTGRLNIIFTTRSARKSADTLESLRSHLQRRHTPAQHARVTFQPESVELTNLVSIRTLAQKLVASDLETLDSLICNAGIGGWQGLNWPVAIRDILCDWRNSTTFPAFKIGTVGSVTKRQLPGNAEEPPLGEVFCANTFGHYMLAHWLMPLLRSCEAGSQGKIIWLSSIEAAARHWSIEDLQGLKTSAPYESSKRLTDLLALTSNSSPSDPFVETFVSQSSAVGKKLELKARPSSSTPVQYVCHPGIVVTSVISLPYIIAQAYLLGIYIARWAGASWSTVTPYIAAHCMTWLALSSIAEITAAEQSVGTTKGAGPGMRIGRVKWGTSVNRSGQSTVRPTEVDDWGINGAGTPYASEWWGGNFGRRPGAVEASSSDVDKFTSQGAQAWEQMEKLRQDWEARLSHT